MKNDSTNKVNFTKKFLENLEPTGRDYVIHDTKVAGLYIIVRGKGKKVFWFRGRLHGIQRKYNIGEFPNISVENARKKVEEYKGKLVVGKNPVEMKSFLTKDMTFGQMANDFIENYAKIHKKSWPDDEAVIKNHLENWVNKKASSITKEMVRELHIKIGKTGSKTGANRVLEKIRAIYNRAIDNDWKGNNPASRIKKYAELPRHRFLTLEEMPKFIRSVEEESSRQAKDFIMIALLTGVRKGNILSMKWEDLELKAKIPMWNIPMTKNGKPHSVTLPPILVEILKSRKILQENSKYVFPGGGKTGHYQDPKKAWSRILKRAEINPIRIHDLRRTIATTLIDNNVSRSIVEDILGHTSRSVTDTYARTRPETMLKTLTEASDIMLIKYAGGINKWW